MQPPVEFTHLLFVINSLQRSCGDRAVENRIAFERRKYNDVARAFNTKRDTIPTVFVAGMFGSRFNEKPYFAAQPGAQTPPAVNFGQ